MRLSAFEREQIVQAARRHFGTGSRVVLFGSRVDDQARGGDIDLMIETPAPVEQPLQRNAEFLLDLWRRIGEQRIDVVLKTPVTTPEPIHQIAEALGVTL